MQMTTRITREGVGTWVLSPIARGSHPRFIIERDDGGGYTVLDMDCPKSSQVLATEGTLAKARKVCDETLRLERRAKHEAEGFSTRRRANV
jgi:hypothetical protein